jgi:hypothetical protein
MKVPDTASAIAQQPISKKNQSGPQQKQRKLSNQDWISFEERQASRATHAHAVQEESDHDSSNSKNVAYHEFKDSDDIHN